MNRDERKAAEHERAANLLRRRQQLLRQREALDYELDGIEEIIARAGLDRIGPLFPDAEPDEAEPDAGPADLEVDA